MKKTIITLTLALALVFAAVGCGAKTGNDTAGGDFTGTSIQLAEEIYKKQSVELSLGAPTEIDLTNADNVKYYLGLDDASDIAEACFSEPMMSSQAYSLCVVRVAEGADASAVAQRIFDGIDTRKWCCVEADKLIVDAEGDYVLLVMADSGLGETLCSDLYTAFTSIVGANGTKLEK